MIKALLIDMDGLLIDSEPIAYKVYRDFLNKRGYEFTEDFYYSKMAGHSAADNVKLMFDTYTITGDLDAIFKEIKDTEFSYYLAGIPCKKGAYDLLDFLKENHYKIILSTSSVVPRAMAAINYNDLDKYFDDKVFGPEIGRSKPFPDIFLKACEKSGCKLDECLVLEDAESGIMAANNAGIKVICIPDAKEPNEELKSKCEAVLEDLNQVIDYLKEDQKKGTN